MRLEGFVRPNRVSCGRPLGRFVACGLAATLLAAVAGPATAEHVDPRGLGRACPDNQVTAGQFSDVSAADPFELAIGCLADAGVTHGVSPTRYEPGGTVSRRQMAQFLYRLGGRGGISWDLSDAGFRDVDALGSEERAAINALKNAGVAMGLTGTLFGPNGTVTRGQMASFIVRLATAAGAGGFSSQQNAFDDDEGLIHEPNIDRLAGAGITTGRGTHRTFDPGSAVPRGQMAAFLTRALDVLVEQDLAASAYSAGVAPVATSVAQAGRIVQPGSEISGEATGDRIASVSMTGGCVDQAGHLSDRDPSQPGVQFTAAVSASAAAGRCDVSVQVTFANGRTRSDRHTVLIAGYTARPELVSLETVSTGPDSITSTVRFRFDEPVVLPPDHDRGLDFQLIGFNAYWLATSARAEGDSVIAQFGTPQQPVGDEELSQVSFAVSARGAVVGLDGQDSVLGRAVPHPGMTTAQVFAGPTWQADLLTVTPSRATPSPSTFDFTFDARPDRSASQHEFAVILTDGTTRTCTTAGTVPARQVTATCAGVTIDQIARGVVSVRLSDQLIPYRSGILRRGSTPAPDVVAARRGTDVNELTITFDEPVTLAHPDRILVTGPGVQSLGHAQSLPAAVSPTDPRQVVLTGRFPGEASAAALLTVRGGAVTSRTTGAANVLEQTAVEPPHNVALPAGWKAGLKLLSATLDGQTVRLTYDGTVFLDDETGNVRIEIYLYTPDGTELTCGQISGTQARSIDCTTLQVIAADGVHTPATAEHYEQLVLATVSDYSVLAFEHVQRR